MHVRVEINSIGRWETARHPETDEPMDSETDELPSEELLLATKRHNNVNRRRIRVVVDDVPVKEDRPGTRHFNLGTEAGSVQLPHGALHPQPVEERVESRAEVTEPPPERREPTAMRLDLRDIVAQPVDEPARDPALAPTIRLDLRDTIPADEA